MKSLDELRLDDFRLNLKGRSLVPVMQGGMGVNISTAEMAQAVAARGGIGHVSDAMIPDLADRLFGTGFTRMKTIPCKKIEKTMGQAGFLFPVDKIREAAKLYLGSVMEGKKGEGLIHVNVMEKLTMNSGLETLKARLLGALDAGIDGISLSAGLHTSSFALMSEHPRFRDACLGVVVSSRRALNLFLRKSAKTERLPDYIVVEGPLAGGHLGFGMDWANFSLPDIVRDVKAYLAENKLSIPVLAAGGVFTGTDGVRMMQEAGADGIQAATRFAVTKESGLPDDVKQQYFNARAEDIEVNGISPTGYPMRMLKSAARISRPGARPRLRERRRTASGRRPAFARRCAAHASGRSVRTGQGSRRRGSGMPRAGGCFRRRRRCSTTTVSAWRTRCMPDGMDAVHRGARSVRTKGEQMYPCGRESYKTHAKSI